MNNELTDEQRRGLDTVEKLLRLAGKNPNENEAAAATAKAMAMLADLNLTLASVDETGEGGGRRAEEKLVGGFYEFERDLWSRIAELNFCLCWHQKSWVKRPPTTARKAMMIQDPFRRAHILRGQFKVIGRMHNIAATKVMAGYLLGAIERLTRERLHEDGVTESVNTQLRSRWAVSFREGIAERIAEKLWDRRQQQISEERQKAREEEARAREAGMAGASTATTLTLSSLRKTEEEANMDFVMGEGWSARRAQARADAARHEKEAREAYTKWAAANPEEARKQEEEKRKADRKRSTRRYSEPKEKERDWGAYRAGYEAGDSVGIDQQAGERKVAGALA